MNLRAMNASPDTTAADGAALRALMGADPRVRRAIRDRNTFEAYLSTLAPSGRFLVFPMGADGRLAMARLRDVPGFLGGVDSAADAADRTSDPVITPSCLARTSFDEILVCHIDPETEATLVAHLAAAGVPRERLIPVYDDPRYAAFACEHRGRALLDGFPSSPRGASHVVVRDASAPLAGDAALATLHPPSTPILVVDDGATTTHDPDGPVFGLGADPSPLRPILRAIDPRVVHLRCADPRPALVDFIRSAVPSAVLLHEHVHGGGDGNGDDRIDGTAVTIHPAGGEEPTRRFLLHPLFDGAMDDARRGLPAGFTYLPPSPPPSTGDAPSSRRILLAGDLPPATSGGDGGDGDRWSAEALRSIITDAGASMDLCDLARAGHPRAMRPGRLLLILKHYDYGWVEPPRTDDPPPLVATAAHRLSLYVSANLPVIIDERLVALAALVERHGAGIVVDTRDPGALRRALGSSDPIAHRTGARRLHAFLRERNERTLEAVREVVMSMTAGMTGHAPEHGLDPKGMEPMSRSPSPGPSRAIDDGNRIAEQVVGQVETRGFGIHRGLFPRTTVGRLRRRMVELYDRRLGPEPTDPGIDVVHFDTLLGGEHEPVVIDVLDAFIRSIGFDIFRRLIGGRVQFLVFACLVRSQRPGTRSSRVPFHQDVTFMTNRFRSFNCWIPLVDCGTDSPGLEMMDARVVDDLSDLIDADHAPDSLFRELDLTRGVERIVARHPGATFATPVMNAGDALIFDQLTVHRTQPDMENRRRRISLEIRAAAEDAPLADHQTRHRFIIEEDDGGFVWFDGDGRPFGRSDRVPSRDPP